MEKIEKMEKMEKKLIFFIFIIDNIYRLHFDLFVALS